MARWEVIATGKYRDKLNRHRINDEVVVATKKHALERGSGLLKSCLDEAIYDELRIYIYKRVKGNDLLALTLTEFDIREYRLNGAGVKPMKNKELRMENDQNSKNRPHPVIVSN